MSHSPLNTAVLSAIMAAIPHVALPTLSIAGVGKFSSQFASTGTTASGTTSASNSTFVMLMTYGNNASPTSVTDSNGNTYVQKFSGTYFSGLRSYFVYACENGTGGAGHTGTATFATGDGLLINLIEIRSTGAAAVFEGVGTSVNATSTTTITTSSLTTTHRSAVLSFAANIDSTVTQTVSDSFGNILLSELAGSTYGLTDAVGGLVQSSAGAVSDTFTWGTGVTGGAIIAAWH